MPKLKFPEFCNSENVGKK